MTDKPLSEEDEASAIVNAIFADLRDRRFLKWLFGPPGSATTVMEGLERLDDDVQVEIAKAWRDLIQARRSIPSEEEDEIYQSGVREGYESAVQDIDLLTGGDGEYRFCTDGDPGRHTPDADAMKARIVERFSPSLHLDPVREAVARKLAELKGHRDLEAEIWLNKQQISVPIWQCYLEDAESILALFSPAVQEEAFSPSQVCDPTSVGALDHD